MTWIGVQNDQNCKVYLTASVFDVCPSEYQGFQYVDEVISLKSNPCQGWEEFFESSSVSSETSSSSEYGNSSSSEEECDYETVFITYPDGSVRIELRCKGSSSSSFQNNSSSSESCAIGLPPPSYNMFCLIGGDLSEIITYIPDLQNCTWIEFKQVVKECPEAGSSSSSDGSIVSSSSSSFTISDITHSKCCIYCQQSSYVVAMLDKPPPCEYYYYCLPFGCLQLCEDYVKLVFGNITPMTSCPPKPRCCEYGICDFNCSPVWMYSCLFCESFGGTWFPSGDGYEDWAKENCKINCYYCEQGFYGSYGSYGSYYGPYGSQTVVDCLPKSFSPYPPSTPCSTFGDYYEEIEECRKNTPCEDKFELTCYLCPEPPGIECNSSVSMQPLGTTCSDLGMHANQEDCKANTPCADEVEITCYYCDGSDKPCDSWTDNYPIGTTCGSITDHMGISGPFYSNQSDCHAWTNCSVLVPLYCWKCEWYYWYGGPPPECVPFLENYALDNYWPEGELSCENVGFYSLKETCHDSTDCSSPKEISCWKCDGSNQDCNPINITVYNDENCESHGHFTEIQQCRDSTTCSELKQLNCWKCPGTGQDCVPESINTYSETCSEYSSNNSVSLYESYDECSNNTDCEKRSCCENLPPCTLRVSYNKCDGNGSYGSYGSYGSMGCWEETVTFDTGTGYYRPCDPIVKQTKTLSIPQGVCLPANALVTWSAEVDIAINGQRLNDTCSAGSGSKNILIEASTLTLDLIDTVGINWGGSITFKICPEDCSSGLYVFSQDYPISVQCDSEGKYKYSISVNAVTCENTNIDTVHVELEILGDNCNCTTGCDCSASIKSYYASSPGGAFSVSLVGCDPCLEFDCYYSEGWKQVVGGPYGPERESECDKYYRCNGNSESPCQKDTYFSMGGIGAYKNITECSAVCKETFYCWYGCYSYISDSYYYPYPDYDACSKKCVEKFYCDTKSGCTSIGFNDSYGLTEEDCKQTCTKQKWSCDYNERCIQLYGSAGNYDLKEDCEKVCELRYNCYQSSDVGCEPYGYYTYGLIQEECDAVCLQSYVCTGTGCTSIWGPTQGADEKTCKENCLVPGCTDPSNFNYNQYATCDNGTCYGEGGYGSYGSYGSGFYSGPLKSCPKVDCCNYKNINGCYLPVIEQVYYDQCGSSATSGLPNIDPNSAVPICVGGGQSSYTVSGFGFTTTSTDSLSVFVANKLNSSYTITNINCFGNGSVTENFSNDGGGYITASINLTSRYASIAVVSNNLINGQNLIGSLELNLGYLPTQQSSCNYPLYDCSAFSGTVTSGFGGDYSNASLSVI